MKKNYESERLKSMVEIDGNGEIADCMRVVRADMYALLKEFMEVSAIDTTVEKTESGYRVTFAVDALKLYGVGKIEH